MNAPDLCHDHIGRYFRAFSTGAGLTAVVVLLAACAAAPSAAPQRPTVTAGVASTSPSNPVPATTSAAPPATSVGSTAAAAASSIADGTYRLSATPMCGEFAMDGATLVIRGNAATIDQGIWDGADPNSPGRPASGTVTTKGTSFKIHVANGTAAIIDLNGTVGAAGTLTGSGQSGGLHLSGETGWVCQFTFTATRGTAGGSAGRTLNTDTFFSPTKNISCQILPDSVYCQTWTPQQSVKMSPSGTFTTCTGPTCQGDPGEHTPVLAYGDTTVVGPFKCTSATGGVTCTAAGKGFQISRSGVTKAP